VNGQVKQNIYTNSISALNNNKDPRRRKWESSHNYNNKEEDKFLPIETNPLTKIKQTHRISQTQKLKEIRFALKAQQIFIKK